MDKVFNHKNYEEELYNLWEKSGVFTPKITASKKPFCIIMPPPNANDDLHIGHARFITVQDILIRYKRMRGYSTLWLPGADHAGIETQYVFEKRLRQQGKSRFDYDYESLYKMIYEYVFKYKGNMEKQLRRMGASCDWTRNKFTLDDKIVKIVYKTFKKLYDDGLIYRGERIVNYCPACGTSLSELEVKYQERDDPFYYLDYKTVVIATTRPETIFADVAVAVNPKDKKYKKLLGKKAVIPLIEREIPIIQDSLVEIGFGTGALKITPGHDPLDFEIGKKHKLATISVIDDQGKMVNTPEKYIGLKPQMAREEVLKDLKTKGLIKKIETIHHSVGTCYRCGGVIEPLIRKQWFLKVTPLAKKSLDAINKKEVVFVSKKFEKIARHWFKNLKDWNISRQIIWGIKIPAWRCEKCLNWTITEGETPKACNLCNGKVLKQDSDTFDTWFSSGQWPYATLLASSEVTNLQFPILNKNKDKFSDFGYFYPTSIMETAYDILPFWVIRMIMLGLWATGKAPFKEVLIHGLVRDKHGAKISKSIGNVINPLVMIEKYGADALRMGLVWGTLVENDISLSEENIKGQRNFANKIWNIARFILSYDGDKKPIRNPRSSFPQDKAILTNLKKTVKKVTRLLEKYRLNEATEELYRFVWHDFANTYLESAKKRRDESQKILLWVLQESLKILHPFMPFVTEAIWQIGKENFDSPLLASASWPILK